MKNKNFLCAVAILNVTLFVAAGSASQNIASLNPMVGQGKAAVEFIPSGKLDLSSDTITLPLHHGHLKNGRNVWFILTDTSNKQRARDLGIAYSPALSRAANAVSTRTANLESNGNFVFDSGTVDFSPQHQVAPGMSPNFFPPTVAQAGSIGDASYSPFVKVTDDGNNVYNAPILAFDVSANQIAFCAGNPDHNIVHDKVVKICPQTGSVTLALSHGFAATKSIVYLSFEVNDPLGATLEASTYTPAINDLKTAGVSLDLYAFVNGEIGVQNPERQGFNSALHGDGSPLNILDGLPSVSSGYSPLWDVHIGVWTDLAIKSGQRKHLTNGTAVAQALASGLITGPGGSAYGSSGILVNCPIVAIVK